MSLRDIKATIVTGNQICMFYTPNFETRFEIIDFESSALNLNEIYLNENQKDIGYALWKYLNFELLRRISNDRPNKVFFMSDLESICQELIPNLNITKSGKKENKILKRDLEKTDFEISLDLEFIDLVSRNTEYLNKRYISYETSFKKTTTNPNLYIRTNLREIK